MLDPPIHFLVFLGFFFYNLTKPLKLVRSDHFFHLLKKNKKFMEIWKKIAENKSDFFKSYEVERVHVLPNGEGIFPNIEWVRVFQNGGGGRYFQTLLIHFIPLLARHE